MLSHSARISLKVLAVLLKILSAYCALVYEVKTKVKDRFVTKLYPVAKQFMGYVLTLFK